MVSQGPLDKNLYYLRLAQDGEIMFGGINKDLYGGELVTLPLKRTNDSWLSGRWGVEARFISLVGAKHNVALDGYTAVLESGFSFLAVDPKLLHFFNAYIGAEQVPWYAMPIPCERRALLFDLTFNLAGYNFTIKPYDYTREVQFDDNDGGLRCVSAFERFEAESGEEPYIVLGSAFMEAFYSVFDLDNEAVKCKSNRKEFSFGIVLFIYRVDISLN
jgi:saccharopepsin